MKSSLRHFFIPTFSTSPWDNEIVIREELFSTERLEQHAASLAEAQQITSHPLNRPSLKSRLRENAAVLLTAYRDIAASVERGDVITPSAEWLLDNYHLVEEQVRQAQEDLSPRYYRQLPKLVDGPFVGYPRVFGMAWAMIAHSDSRLDPDNLRRFVRAYQKVQPLTIGELWAIAITLRIVLVENLRRAAGSIVNNRMARREADLAADLLLSGDGEADPVAVLDGYSDRGVLSAAFAVQLIKRLRDQDPKVMPALTWLDAHLAKQGTTSDEIVRAEHQRQGASNVTVRNIITSMRLLSDVNWPDFIESVSLVDEVLRSASDFGRMDFATRNLYRNRIEQLGRGSSRSEQEIAAAVVATVGAAVAARASTRERDPGYYLLGAGRDALEVTLGYRPPLVTHLNHLYSALGPAGYIVSVASLTILALLAPLLLLRLHGIGDAALGLFALIGLIPASDVAVAGINRALARSLSARTLPALALSEGVPESLRTLVVVPTLLTSREDIESQLERLEVHYLASAHGEIHFALLSDWADADHEKSDADEALLKIANDGVARLNRLHGPMAAGKRFYLLHRRRVWSEDQRGWIGWERKRGKLHELNRLLRGATDTTFIGIDQANAGPPAGVRYVVTLDADTRLPRETVRRLVGKMAHPLNQPVFDVSRSRVSAGYAVLQPRVTASLPLGQGGSLYQRIFSNMAGIDPYAAAVSDVYQDLFGEGSYAGKGIYDVDAFEAALAGRVPEATLLSHDLFEGTYARAGLASDVEVVEDFPSRYDVAAMRAHRWARGDWQLLPWIVALDRRSRHGPHSLPLLGLWKMIDNLRRSLSAPACLIALLAGWLLPWPGAGIWTTFVLLAIAFPPLLAVFTTIIPPRRDVIVHSHWRALRHDSWLALLQIGLSVTFLAHQAWLMLDAIGRTLFRLTISRRNLLEWVTAAQAQLIAQPSLGGFYRNMLASVITALLALWESGVAGTSRWLVAPFALLWLAAPAVARSVSASPSPTGAVPVTAEDAQVLRLIARRTWRFFERFVSDDSQSLPPDNFQEDPTPVLARRTSPTNIGLYLLCTVSAHDFGWVGTTDAAERLAATLGTMHRLQRYRGHFYNWYDTHDLRPLDPPYVSSVDSGNLAAHLMAVANACKEWALDPLAPTGRIAGTDDALQLTAETLAALVPEHGLASSLRRELEGAVHALRRALLQARQSTDPGACLPELAAHAATLVDSAQALAGENVDEAHADLLFWAQATGQSIGNWQRDLALTEEELRTLRQRLRTVEVAARELALEMEFGFLLDPERRLLSIGFRTIESSLDESCYDLLASEARLASFVAIAKNDVAARHWFRLGRTVTPLGAGAALVSWSGSMFEYLMPSIVMRAPVGSLLEQTNRLIVQRQIGYANSLGIPWGISESAYNARDLELTYQYSNFGVPGLGLKRGLSENTVIAPYATGLAAMVDPHAAVLNFARLARIGARGRYGYYEALDYTPSRLPEGEKVVIVRAFMAHHQGMTLTGIGNVIFDGRLRTRFHAEPSVRATELLLQERAPRDVSIAYPRAEEVKTAARLQNDQLGEVRRFDTAHSATPQTHLLSNGHYAVMLTGAGSGYSRWNDLAVTRWREDATRDDTGSYIYLRDVADGFSWSAGFQPCGVEPDSYEALFTEDRAQIVRVDGTLTTTLQVLVSSEDDAEVRRVSITNSGGSARDIDVTSYSELALASPGGDAAHPAFSKMFVETEYIAKVGTLLATRRRRSPDEVPIWAAHQVVVEGEMLRPREYETDRARFLGRGNDSGAPAAITDGRRLSNTVGTVLDPVFALRVRIRVAPGATVHVSFWTAVASAREGVLDLFDKHHDPNAFARAATLAWTQAQVQLRHLGLSADDANVFQQLAGYLLYPSASLRPSSDIIQRSSATRAALWAQGISGDLPLVLLRINHIEDINVVRQLLQAHEYWQLKQLAIDVVILNERGSSYIQDLQVALETMVRVSRSQPRISGAKGSVFVLRADLMAPDSRATLASVARIVLAGQRGSLTEQLERRSESPAVREPVNAVPQREITARPLRPVQLEFYNGVGGFAADGHEYVSNLQVNQPTPAPWINVITNPLFGFQVSAEGGGYTWSTNSRENQLTQWCNDPVGDRPGEVFYIRDEEGGELWGPTVAPVHDAAASYRVHHGQGYSRFEHSAHGIALELLMYVPVADPIKICRLKVRNTLPRRRRLSVTAYVEWVLGTSREASAPYIVTSIDPATGAMFARNPWNTVFGTSIAFADLGGRQTQWTADRREFLGRHGRLDRPAGLLGTARWSKRTGAGLDPCCALQAPLLLEPDQTAEVVFFLGQTASSAEAQALVRRYRVENLDAALQAVTAQWNEVLGCVQVKTPDRAFDLMLNRWLLYQTLACRIWARSAFYQASGAYGFRDQLQDGMALAVAKPALTREHLLRAAGRQFPAGDVQHWWQPPSGQGVRTHISDDRVWLAYTVHQYIRVSGDATVLDEPVAFIDGPEVPANQHDAYYLPTVAAESGSLFEHCARGLDAALKVGAHGLPLMGTGDWNDGMNRVGEKGRGESVWLAWFLYATLSSFTPIAESRGEQARVQRWRAHAAALQGALEREAWDGGWYRRGFFDDGTPYGSAVDSECRIDAIAQSWAVISGAAEPGRAATAMAAVDAQLIRQDERLSLLFTPPFNHTPLDPGYVKGYPPGLRENGGQYTHAATWNIFAFTALGQGAKAVELFSLLNPINHSSTRTGARRYKVEPYVVAADIYSVSPHVGRGGWTWYTGSAAWLYRAGLEAILGFHQEGDHLRLAPCIAPQWPQFEVTFRYRSARYHILVENPASVTHGIARLTLDGGALPASAARVPLQDDGALHEVRVTLG